MSPVILSRRPLAMVLVRDRRMWSRPSPQNQAHSIRDAIVPSVPEKVPES